MHVQFLHHQCLWVHSFLIGLIGAAHWIGFVAQDWRKAQGSYWRIGDPLNNSRKPCSAREKKKKKVWLLGSGIDWIGFAQFEELVYTLNL